MCWWTARTLHPFQCLFPGPESFQWGMYGIKVVSFFCVLSVLSRSSSRLRNYLVSSNKLARERETSCISLCWCNSASLWVLNCSISHSDSVTWITTLFIQRWQCLHGILGGINQQCFCLAGIQCVFKPTWFAPPTCYTYSCLISWYNIEYII